MSTMRPHPEQGQPGCPNGGLTCWRRDSQPPPDVAAAGGLWSSASGSGSCWSPISGRTAYSTLVNGIALPRTRRSGWSTSWSASCWSWPRRRPAGAPRDRHGGPGGARRRNGGPVSLGVLAAPEASSARPCCSRPPARSWRSGSRPTWAVTPAPGRPRLRPWRGTRRCPSGGATARSRPGARWSGGSSAPRWARHARGRRAARSGRRSRQSTAPPRRAPGARVAHRPAASISTARPSERRTWVSPWIATQGRR